MGSGIEDFEMWFSQDGNDLRIDVLNEDSSVTFDNWFTSNDQKVDSITVSTGKSVDASAVNQLISAMATFDPSSFASVNDATELPQDVQNAITANWT